MGHLTNLMQENFKDFSRVIFKMNVTSDLVFKGTVMQI